MMHYLLLPLLGAALTVSSLQADSLTLSAALYGQNPQSCQITSMDCLVGDTTGAYARSFYTRAVNGNTIDYVMGMNIIGGPGISYGQTSIIGTIDLPSNWTSMEVNTGYGESNVSANVSVVPSFDHQQPIPSDEMTYYTLDPGTPNVLNVVANAVGGQAGEVCGAAGCSVVRSGGYTLVLYLTGDAPVLEPTPEPSAFLLAGAGIFLLATTRKLFLPRRRTRKA